MNGTIVVAANDFTKATRTPWAIRWLTWPLLFIGSVGADLHAIAHGWNYSKTYGLILFANILILVALETLFPLTQQWQMTKQSFKRDLKYLVVGSLSITAINALFGLASIRLNGSHTGPLSSWPLYFSVPMCLLAFEFLQYWQHSLSHEMSGKAGDFLWRTHVAHHLPSQVYMFMHIAGHPINAFIVRGLVTLLPLYMLGASARAVLLVNTIIAGQGLISHCNLELRMGWFNYLLTGNELHRFHHSADSTKSCNYGVATPVFDLIFGTFYYQPQSLPHRIGVYQPSLYPDSNQFRRVMRLPFVRIRQNNVTQSALGICLMIMIALHTNTVIANENKLLVTQDGELHVKADGFKNSNGHAIARLYHSGDNVLSTPWRQVRADINDGKAMFSFTQLAFGLYAVVVLHDLNDNGEVDHNFFRLPAEPLGFSNSFTLGLFSGKPTFEKLKFDFSPEKTTIQISIK